MPAPTSSSTASSAGRYAPAQRLHQVRSLLDSAAGATVYDVAERLGVSVRTAIAYHPAAGPWTELGWQRPPLGIERIRRYGSIHAIQEDGLLATAVTARGRP